MGCSETKNDLVLFLVLTVVAARKTKSFFRPVFGPGGLVVVWKESGNARDTEITVGADAVLDYSLSSVRVNC